MKAVAKFLLGTDFLQFLTHLYIKVQELLIQGVGKSRFTGVKQNNTIINNTRVNFCVLTTVNLLLLIPVYIALSMESKF